MTPQEWNLFIDLREWIIAIVVTLVTLALAPALRAALQNYKNHLRFGFLGELASSIALNIYPAGLRIALDVAPLPAHFKGTLWLEAAVYILFVCTIISTARKAALLTIEWSAVRGPKSSKIFQHGFIPILRNGATVISLTVGCIMVLKYFGYDVLSLVTALGVGSLAVGMAAKETLTNMISGFTLIIDQNFHTGDKINLTGSIGIVEEIGLRNTRINMRDGTTLIVPNSDLVNNRILNMSSRGLAGTAALKFRIPMNVAFERVKKISEEIFAEVKETIPEKGIGVTLASVEEGNQLISQLATSWLVYRLTNSPLWLGVAAFASQIPSFLFGFYAGVIADRIDKHRLLIWTQSLMAIQALILFLLTFTGKITLYELIVLNFLLGLLNAFDMPGRQSFVVQMIDHKRDLPNAIALSSSIMNATRLIGPAIAGITIATVGEAACFLLNAVSYVAVIVALLMMKLNKPKITRSAETILQSMRAGFVFASRDRSIRVILIHFAFLSFVGTGYMTLFPAIAARMHDGGANTLGWISAASGSGALLGTLFLTLWRKPPLFARIMAWATLSMAAGLIGLSLSNSFGIVMLCVFAGGLGMVLQFAAGNTVIQTVVDDDKRGRVMSFFTFSLLGVSPFGNLLIGWIAQRLDLSRTFLFEGICCTVGAAVFFYFSGSVNHEIAEKINLAAIP
ncbi:unnamed protein product [Sphagnum jensenii]|uniref:Major facilitator superfamily (MFS) profile domain-containing protein n=1 Tax=Sphagnum jensenii TaxID=128206 RepID=A0ABP0V7G1_9BRYO